jgi:hypothetical protein
MKRPASVRGKGSYMAAGLIVGVLTAAVLAVSSTSKPPTVSLAAAHVASSSAAASPVHVHANPVRKATAVQPEVSVEKFPSLNAPSLPATTATAAAPAHAYGCAAALAYLHAHAEPHFTILCPGRAYNPQGGPAQAMTCVSHPPQCPLNTGVIAISDPCPIAYMNEAANSWIALGLRPGAMDPYGPSC